MIRWNVPGSIRYLPGIPLDIIIRSIKDNYLRGYWLERDHDGQVVFVSNQNNADFVTLDVDPDGFPVIVYDDELSEDFSYDGMQTIMVRGDF